VSYAVSIRRSAQKELETIPSPSYQKIEDRMLALGNNPRPAGCKMLKGAEKSWRIRVGDYRLVYEIDDAARAVTVIKIAHRSDVYR
jgi:mRNA interferase RelE/StbE